MSTLFFILNTISLFILAQCIFVYALVRYLKPAYKSTKKIIFLLLLFIVTLAYIVMDFTDITSDILGGTILLRCIDYVGCVLLFLCWIFIFTTNNTIQKCIVTISSLEIIIDIIISIYYMADDYTIDPKMQFFWLISSLIFLLAKILFVIIAFKQKDLNRISDIISAMFLLFIISGYYEDILISLGRESALYVYIITVCSIILSGMSMLYELTFNTLFPLVSQDQSRLFSFIRETYNISNRENEIMQLLYKHFTEKEISEMLHISISTVKTHKKNIYMKLNVTSKNELLHLINSIHSQSIKYD